MFQPNTPHLGGILQGAYRQDRKPSGLSHGCKRNEEALFPWHQEISCQNQHKGDLTCFILKQFSFLILGNLTSLIFIEGHRSKTVIKDPNLENFFAILERHWAESGPIANDGYDDACDSDPDDEDTDPVVPESTSSAPALPALPEDRVPVVEPAHRSDAKLEMPETLPSKLLGAESHWPTDPEELRACIRARAEALRSLTWF